MFCRPLALVFIVLPACALATPYNTTPITILGFQVAEAADVSENGFVAVTGRNTDHRAFLWSKSGGAVEIPKPSGVVNMFANSVNNLGQVVGRAVLSSGFERGFLYTPGVGTTLLDLPSGYTTGYARSINNLGEIVGHSWNSSTAAGVRWSPGGGMTISEAPAGYAARMWMRINDSNVIVGDTAIAFQGWRATYQSGASEAIYDLPPTFQGATVTGLSSNGWGLGSVSKTTGSHSTAVTTTQTFVFDGSSILRELIPGAGLNQIYGTSINASGTIAATLAGPGLSASVLYLNGSSTPSLFNDLVGDGVNYGAIYDLNDAGQLTVYSDGKFYFAEPVPEPATLGALGLGAILLGRRRKR